MDLDIAGRRAVVTGASRGIGLAIARSLAGEGCHVRIVSRDRERLDRAAADLDALGIGKIEVEVADLSRSDDAERIATMAAGADILVNNAGAIPRGTLDDLDNDTMFDAWRLKLFGFLTLTRRSYAAMRARGTGVIANVIGVAGERPSADYIAGSIANAGLIAMTKALGSEGPSYGVRVVGVNPGPTLTDRQLVRWRRRSEQQLGTPERWAELTRAHPFGRLADPAEIADTVAFLCSPRSSYTSGVVVTIDGGMSLRRE